jgi:hypothetical protein
MNINTSATPDLINVLDYVNKIVFNPMILITILLVIIGYFMLSSSSLGKSSDISINNTSTESNIGQNFSSFIGFIIIFVLIVLISIFAFQYFLNVSITSYFKDYKDFKIFKFFEDTTDFIFNKPKLDILSTNVNYNPTLVPSIKFKKQVFNIPGNYYNYENAKAMCASHGANLATYKQIEDSYENGADWCNYGWSEGQNAFFPTQQKTFDKLQGIKGHEHDCGRPGINGGYMANPEIKFGVNCYGNKRKINVHEENLMKTMSPFPQTKEDLVFQKRVDYWKDKVDEVLLSPFNHNSWNQ